MAVMLGVEDMYKFMYNSKPKPFVRTYSEPVRRVLPAIYNITDTDLNTAGPTRELPPRTCSRYDIRPEMPVGPNGVLEDVVYDMDDTGVYHPNTKKARALEKEMGVDEDKEAVKKKKQKMMYRQRAQKRKEKGERPTGEDQDVGNVAAEHKDSGSDMLALEHSLHVVIKILSEPGKAKLKAIGTESDHWPAFKYSPAAEIALENIITAEGRKRKAALAPPIRFESESGDEEEYESGDDHDDDDWKAPGQRVRRHRLTKTGVCKDCPELGNPRSDLAEDDGSDSTLSNRVQTYTFSENHSGAYSRKGTNNDDPGQSNEIQELYCTCQQPEQGFMIKCEGPCNNWYHGKCVGITRVKARLIPQYICNDCAAAEIQEGVVVGKSNIGIRYGDALHLQSNLGPTHVGLQPAKIQEDATVGQSSVVTTLHEHPVQSKSDPVSVDLHGAEIQQDAVVEQLSNFVFEDAHPAQSHLGQINDKFPAPGTSATIILGSARIITTRLAQPVQLFFEPNPADYHGDIPACHWCDDPAYAVLGLEKMTYCVYELTNWLGYQEVAGGHRSKGYPASRMCISCTLTRFNILSCPEHTLEILPANERKANEEAARRLGRYELTGNENQYQWCSLCPEPAEYKCNKSHGINQDGCGLKLCCDCGEWLLEEHNGDLDALIELLIAANVKRHGKEFEGVRPDAAFLLQRGEMTTRLNGGSL